MRATFKKPSLRCLVQQAYWSDLRIDAGTLFYLDRIQTPHSQTQLHLEDRFSSSNGDADLDSWYK